MTDFALRVKTDKGQQVLKDLSSTSTLRILRQKLANLSNISESRVSILVGYPPKPVDLSSLDQTLEEGGVKTGETVIVKELPAEQVPDIVANTMASQQSQQLPEVVTTDSMGCNGILLRQVVPSDNSCLFTSIGYVLGGKVDSGPAAFMREIIAETVQSDPENYSEAVLGRPAKDYCKWIKGKEAWGGAIELAILSSFYGFEIVVVNSLHGIVNRFGEDQKYGTRAFLIYDGIHYDPLYLEPFDGSKAQTLFPTTEERILEQALQLAKEAQHSRQFTDTDKFSLRCLQCEKLLTGQVEAQQHAVSSGHVSFGEVNPS